MSTPTPPSIPEDQVNEDTFYGTYPDLERLVIAINEEINGLNIYRVIDEDNKLLKYTFEAEE